MHILALVTEAFGGSGGIAQYNRDFLAACAQARIEVTCSQEKDKIKKMTISPLESGSQWGSKNLSHTAGEEGEGVKITIVPRLADKRHQDLPNNLVQKRPLKNRSLFTLNTVLTVLREGPFDIIFCGHLFMAPLAMIVAKLWRKPFWLQIHGIEAWDQPSYIIHRTAEEADLVTAVSRYTRRRFLSWANVAPHTVKVLPNMVDGHRFSPGPKPKYLLKRHKLEGKKVLLTVGRLSRHERYKGHDKVIHVLPQLRQKLSNVVYVIAGDGDDRPHLERLAASYGVSDDVRFLGQVPGRELPDLFRMADLFIMPSAGEGFGIVFLQAIATGLPTVAADRGGSADPLRDGEYGYLIETDGVREAILTALREPRADCRARSREVRRIFGRDYFVQRAAEIVGVMAAA